MTDNAEIKIRETDMVGDEELHLLQRRLEHHIGRFDEHVAQQDKRWDQLIQSQEDTNKSIKELVICTTELHTSTKDVVEAWNAAEGAVKVGAVVGRFVKWVAGFAVLASALSWIGLALPKK